MKLRDMLEYCGVTDYAIDELEAGFNYAVNRCFRTDILDLLDEEIEVLPKDYVVDRKLKDLRAEGIKAINFHAFNPMVLVRRKVEGI